MNVAKTEVILFKTKSKNLDTNLNIKLSRKKLHISKYVKYLGVFIDENLNWKNHVKELSVKLLKANAMLSMIRQFVNKEVLRMIYHSIFQSHVTYNCIAWGQINTSLNRITLLQKKAIRIISHASYRDHTPPLFAGHRILKLQDIVSTENCKLVHSAFHNDSFSLLSEVFQITSEIHNYSTRNSTKNLLFFIPLSNTKRYGRKSIITSAIKSWNYYQSLFDIDFLSVSVNKIKSILKEYFFVIIYHKLISTCSTVYYCQ